LDFPSDAQSQLIYVVFKNPSLCGFFFSLLSFLPRMKKFGRPATPWFSDRFSYSYIGPDLFGRVKTGTTFSVNFLSGATLVSFGIPAFFPPPQPVSFFSYLIPSK